MPSKLGVKFRSNISGYITGLRFYKDHRNTGTHFGHLWSSDGILWAEAAFTNETVSGWQSISFNAPVAVAAGATYIASYHTDAGNYSVSQSYFSKSYYNEPLYIYASGEITGGNGIYRNGPNRSFPDKTWEASNYWVDVIFATQIPTGPTATPIPLEPAAASPVPKLSLWTETTMPAYSTTGDVNAIEVGVKFWSEATGYITGLRFYKDVHNTGTHYGHLWNGDGKLLAEATFTNETVSGWQSVSFDSPVAIVATFS